MTVTKWVWNETLMPYNQVAEVSSESDSTFSESIIILLAIVLTFVITIIWAKRKGKKNSNKDFNSRE